VGDEVGEQLSELRDGITFALIGPSCWAERKLSRSCPINLQRRVLLALKGEGLPNRLHRAIDHGVKGEGRIHGAEIGGDLPMLENDVWVGPHHPRESSDAVDPPERLDTLVGLPQLIFIQQGLLHLLQQAHQLLVGMVQRLTGRARWTPRVAGLPGLGSGACDVPEFILGRLPDPVVVNYAIASGEAPLLVELDSSLLDILPAVIACFEDGGI
jgi:hypothetical protein